MAIAQDMTLNSFVNDRSKVIGKLFEQAPLDIGGLRFTNASLPTVSRFPATL